MDKLYRGIFWIKDLDNLEENKPYLLKIKINLEGDALSFDLPLNSKDGNNYVHRFAWLMLPKNLTKNKSFDYYPRGRVEIKNKKALLYINPILNEKKIIDYLKQECCLDEVKIILDFHEHYKCELDKEEK